MVHDITSWYYGRFARVGLFESKNITLKVRKRVMKSNVRTVIGIHYTVLWYCSIW